MDPHFDTAKEYNDHHGSLGPQRDADRRFRPPSATYRFRANFGFVIFEAAGRTIDLGASRTLEKLRSFGKASPDSAWLVVGEHLRQSMTDEGFLELTYAPKTEAE